METWQVRLEVERDDLADKLAKLERFLMNEEYLKGINPNHIALLITQTYAMTQYLDILNKRLSYVKE